MTCYCEVEKGQKIDKIAQKVDKNMFFIRFLSNFIDFLTFFYLTIASLKDSEEWLPEEIL